MPWAFVFILAACFKTLSLFTTPSHFLARPAVCGILVPWPGIEPTYPAMEGWSLNHWRAGEVPTPSFLTSYYPSARDLIGGVGECDLPPWSYLALLSSSLFLPSTLAVLYHFFFDLFSSLCPILLSLLPIFFLHPPLSLFLPLLSTLSFPLSFLISSPPPSLSSFSLPLFLLCLRCVSPLSVPVRCVRWCPLSSNNVCGEIGYLTTFQGRAKDTHPGGFLEEQITPGRRKAS